MLLLPWRFVDAAQRTAKDYAYVSANSDHRGPSDPGSYSVSCTHERMRALLRTGLERYNAEMARVAAERERQAKDAALQAWKSTLQYSTLIVVVHCLRRAKTGVRVSLFRQPLYCCLRGQTPELRSNVPNNMIRCVLAVTHRVIQHERLRFFFFQSRFFG